MTGLLDVKLMPVLAACLILGGCQTLPVVPHAINCEISAERLTGKCAVPKDIPNNATYSSLVDTMQADRKALRECSIEADTLREAIRRCNQATEEYNKKIDALNSRK
jgi:hypothetical protein